MAELANVPSSIEVESWRADDEASVVALEGQFFLARGADVGPIRAGFTAPMTRQTLVSRQIGPFEARKAIRAIRVRGVAGEAVRIANEAGRSRRQLEFSVSAGR
jgi:hypothetical protein